MCELKNWWKSASFFSLPYCKLWEKELEKTANKNQWWVSSRKYHKWWL